MKTRDQTSPVFLHGRQGAFTLLELLAVMAIVLILLSLTVLTIGSVGQGRKLTQAGNLTVDLINNARQIAKAKNTMTVLAVINQGVDSGRVLTTLMYTATTGTNGSWARVDQWHPLPDGILIQATNPADSLGNIPPPLFTSTPALDSVPLALVRSGTAKMTVSSAIFLPDGRPLNPISAPQVVTLKGSTAAASNANFYKIIVNQVTGIPLVRRP